MNDVIKKQSQRQVQDTASPAPCRDTLRFLLQAIVARVESPPVQACPEVLLEDVLKYLDTRISQSLSSQSSTAEVLNTVNLVNAPRATYVDVSNDFSSCAGVLRQHKDLHAIVAAKARLNL